jgi:hypothetical protein
MGPLRISALATERHQTLIIWMDLRPTYPIPVAPLTLLLCQSEFFKHASEEIGAFQKFSPHLTLQSAQEFFQKEYLDTRLKSAFTSYINVRNIYISQLFSNSQNLSPTGHRF